jgi:hypothetical protein
MTRRTAADVGGAWTIRVSGRQPSTPAVMTLISLVIPPTPGSR